MNGEAMLEDKDCLKKLFVGGIPHSVSDEEFKEYFGTFGELVDSVIIKDKGSNTSRGFGFVTFSNYQDLNAVLQNRPHRFENKEVEVKRAIPREDSSPTAHTRCKKLFVGGLPKEADEEQLKADLNAQYEHCGLGCVTKIEFIKDRETGKNRGFGFVEVDTEDLADLIIIYDNTPSVNGKKVEIKKAEERGAKGGGQTRGGGRGGSRGGRGGFSSGYGGNSYGGSFGGGSDYSSQMNYDNQSYSDTSRDYGSGGYYGGGQSRPGGGGGYSNYQFGSGYGNAGTGYGYPSSTGAPHGDSAPYGGLGDGYRQGGGGFVGGRGRRGNDPRYHPY